MKTGIRQRRHAAFTLIEIMVALTILALIVTAIYSSWFAILKGSTAAATAAAAAQRSRLSLRMVEDAFLGAVSYTQNARYYTFLADADGDYSSVSFVSRLPKSFLRSRKFDGAEIRRVTFAIEDGPGGDKQLVLRQSLPLMDPDQDEQDNPLIIAHNVKKFDLEYVDPKEPDKFISDWPYTNQIPSGILIVIALGNQDKFSDKPVETLFGVVAPPTKAVRAEWQMPAGVNPSALPVNGLNPGQPGGPTQPGGPAINMPGLTPGGKTGPGVLVR